MKYTEKQIEFIEENIYNFQTIEVGFLKNLDYQTLTGYHTIYLEVIDKSHILNQWCSSCVFEFMERLMINYYNFKSEILKQAEVIDSTAEVKIAQTVQKKQLKKEVKNGNKQR